jgi:hypothetical protein
MTRLKLLAALFAIALTATPAIAEPDKEGAIVIEGERRVKNVLRNFIASLTQAGPTDQLARWKDEVCPTVAGINPAEARFMEDRIIDLGIAAGLRGPDPGCDTTLAVIVTPDADGFANDLVRHYPVTLRTDGLSRLKNFAASSRPVRWISVTNECGEGCALPGSRLRKATRPTFYVMIIVVDAKQVAGFSIGELSDYVALVALSNPPMGGRNSNSILSMFDRPRAQGSAFALTSYDRSFLGGLYGSSIDQSANVQRQSILSHMRKDMQAQH